MICPACNATVTANRFCTDCGGPLDAGGVAPSANDLFEGQSLRTICDRSPLPWQSVCELVSSLCIAVERAGEHLANPDLTPGNIYVEESPGLPPRIKLVVASTAVWRGDADGDTAAGFVFSTKYGMHIPNLEYSSPQRLMGKPLDARDSVFGIGLLAYELLVGRLPFHDAIGAAGPSSRGCRSFRRRSTCRRRSPRSSSGVSTRIPHAAIPGSSSSPTRCRESAKDGNALVAMGDGRRVSDRDLRSLGRRQSRPSDSPNRATYVSRSAMAGAGPIETFARSAGVSPSANARRMGPDDV